MAISINIINFYVISVVLNLWYFGLEGENYASFIIYKTRQDTPPPRFDVTSILNKRINVYELIYILYWRFFFISSYYIPGNERVKERMKSEVKIKLTDNANPNTMWEGIRICLLCKSQVNKSSSRTSFWSKSFLTF